MKNRYLNDVIIGEGASGKYLLYSKPYTHIKMVEKVFKTEVQLKQCKIQVRCLILWYCSSKTENLTQNLFSRCECWLSWIFFFGPFSYGAGEVLWSVAIIKPVFCVFGIFLKSVSKFTFIIWPEIFFKKASTRTSQISSAQFMTF